MTSGVYLGGYPSAHFAFPRSYAYQIATYGDSSDTEIDGNFVTMWINRSIGYAVVYELHPYVLPWSSNIYTLDYLVKQCYWIAFFDGIQHAQDWTVNFWLRGDKHLPTISLVQPSAGIHEFFITLPPAPPGYWLPPFV